MYLARGSYSAAPYCLKVYAKEDAEVDDASGEDPFTSSSFHGLRIYPCPMVWPHSETMVSIPLRGQKTLEIKGFMGLECSFLDLVSQTPRPRGRGRPVFFAEACLEEDYQDRGSDLF